MSRPIVDWFSHACQASSRSLYTPEYTPPTESPLITNSLGLNLDDYFPITASLPPTTAVEAGVFVADPYQDVLIHVPEQQESASVVISTLEEDNYFRPTTLDVLHTTQTPVRSSSMGGIVPLPPVEEVADVSGAIPPPFLSQPLEAFGRMQTFLHSPTATISHPRFIKKDSFAARHRIQVEIPSLPTSESSLVHRTRRGRASATDEKPTRVLHDPVDSHPASRRARQRERNGNSAENYGGSEKRFKCEHCGQAFGRKEHLRRHVSCIHQQIKGEGFLGPPSLPSDAPALAYQCDICGMCCSRSDNLRQHMRAHERDGHTC
jgi:hypothetical protein